ncbi:MAG: ABC transporter permease, partial [Atribacterales bacterium]
NITNLLRDASIIALISAGMTMALLTGGLDLSVGSMLAVSGVFSASLTVYGFLPALLLPLLITTFLGMVSGIIISKAKIQPFIVTLSMMMAGRGLALAFSNETPIASSIKSGFYVILGRGYIFNIPISVVIMLVIYLIVWYLLDKTSFGRSIYAIGGDEKAANLMGINVDLVKIMVYALSGLFAGLAGVIQTSYLGVGSPNAGESYELDAIASAVIGGTLLTGGYGKIEGTLVGAIIIAMIGNILNLVGVISWYQWVIRGFILIIAVVLQNRMKGNKK